MPKNKLCLQSIKSLLPWKPFYVVRDDIPSKEAQDKIHHLWFEWNSGNGVPLAALVIGNKYKKGSVTYPRATVVSLENVTLTTPNESTQRKHLYVYQGGTDYRVVVNGTIVDYASITKNASMNGASVSLSAVTSN